jgi:hypothetical protein
MELKSPAERPQTDNPSRGLKESVVAGELRLGQERSRLASRGTISATTPDAKTQTPGPPDFTKASTAAEKQGPWRPGGQERSAQPSQPGPGLPAQRSEGRRPRPHQLDFTTPGSSPLWARSRNWLRQRPKSL